MSSARIGRQKTTTKKQLVIVSSPGEGSPLPGMVAYPVFIYIYLHIFMIFKNQISGLIVTEIGLL